MKKDISIKKWFSRENKYRLGLAIFGFTLFPAIVFLAIKMFMGSNTTLSAFYGKFYGSLPDLGMDGLYSWSIGCAPYIVYDLYLLIRSFRTQDTEEGKKEE